ncbi:class I SAM-dependent methyltransferase [Bradyrhizobium sp. SYSU BS000235]|uniref:class I SAM-dependent methyltransferase n=1 Tax=Bradyrhizobium sp. SYSU BS000235 TaxID=3411332 RepID=UPI003C70E2F4
MTAADTNFAGSIPEIYDRFLVPLIFEPYARDLADRIARTESQNLLEIAAGTGVLTRALAAKLAPTARIVSTDLNQPMLDYAAARLQQDRVTWRQADALALPFENHSFDVVTCQFGVMFFPDKVKGFSEARRVLKPRGYLMFNVWDRISDNEFADVVTEALASLFPQNPPLFMARIPHGYHDVEKIREDLTAAGFSDISIETIDHVSRAATPDDAAIAYCQGTPLRNEIEARAPLRLEEATQAATDALARRFGNSLIYGRIRAHVISAIPSASQAW